MRNIYLLVLFSIISFCCNAQTPPAQPTTGPGSDNFLHDSVTVYDFGTNKNGDGFWIYEPKTPKPDSANVVVFIHGWGMVNPKYYGAFINRLVRKGNIVIYPRYQKAWDTPNSTYTDTCARSIQRALQELNQPGHVKPRLYNYFVLGHSMGGVLTANMTTKYAAFGIPKPLAAFSMQPGADIAALLLSPADYANFPADVKYLIVVGKDDAIVDSTAGKKLFAQTTAVPTSHKNFIMHFADTHGNPDIGAIHAEPGCLDNNYNTGESNPIILVAGNSAPIDAVDYYCYWKLFDALYECALSGQYCSTAFGDTYEQKFMGNWSDGTPVRPLLVTPANATGINEVSNVNVVVYPNPVSGGLLNFSMDKVAAGTTVSLFDLNGRIITEHSIFSANTTIPFHFTAGLYFYQVKNSGGGIVAKGKVIAE